MSLFLSSLSELRRAASWQDLRIWRFEISCRCLRNRPNGVKGPKLCAPLPNPLIYFAWSRVQPLILVPEVSNRCSTSRCGAVFAPPVAVAITHLHAKSSCLSSNNFSGGEKSSENEVNSRANTARLSTAGLCAGSRLSLGGTPENDNHKPENVSARISFRAVLG
jgi:hypothetical protein